MCTRLRAIDIENAELKKRLVKARDERSEEASRDNAHLKAECDRLGEKACTSAWPKRSDAKAMRTVESAAAAAAAPVILCRL